MREEALQHNAALRLEEFLPYRLWVLSSRVSRSLSRLYEERFDLSISQWRVLAALGESPNLCADEICRITEMDKVSVSRAVHSLLNQGRVERHRDGNDGRRARIRLTRRGKTVYRKLVPLALSLEDGLMHGLSTTEKLQLDRLLSKLIDLAGKVQEQETAGQ